MSGLAVQSFQGNLSCLSNQSQVQAAAPASTTTPPPNPCATALYSATQQLWISMELLKKMILSDPKGTSLEIAYTFFADAVCNWESAYQSFTNSGGQPDPVSEEINQALNATLPDGQTIYQLSQTVSKNPADWQQLQSGVSNNTLFALFEDVNNWVNVDGPAGSEGFTPAIKSNESFYEQLSVILSYLNFYEEYKNTSEAGYYMGLLFMSINNLNSMLANADGPICNLLSEMLNTPFFSYDGKNYSLEEMANYYVTSPNQPTSTQIQEAEDALNSCLPILNTVINMAVQYSLL